MHILWLVSAVTIVCGLSTTTSSQNVSSSVTTVDTKPHTTKSHDADKKPPPPVIIGDTNTINTPRTDGDYFKHFYNERNRYAGTSHYMDNVLLLNLPKIVLGANQDPLALRDFRTETKEKKVFINAKVKTEYNRGTLSGLSRPKRASECSPVMVQDKEERVNCILAFDDLTLKYHGKTQIGKFPKINIGVRAKIERVLVSVLLVTYDTTRIPTIKSISMSNSVSFEPIFSGLGRTTPTVKDLQEGFWSQAKDLVLSALQNEFRASLEEAVQITPFPYP